MSNIDSEEYTNEQQSMLPPFKKQRINHDNGDIGEAPEQHGLPKIGNLGILIVSIAVS